MLSFLPLYLSTERGLQVGGTAAYLLVQIVGGFLGYVSSGFFHDRFGRRPTQTGAYLLAIASTVLFVLTPASTPTVGYLLVFVLGVGVTSCAGGIGAILSEQFPTDVRASGLGFSYNVGRGIAALGPLAVGLLADGIGLGTAIVVVGSGLALVAMSTMWLLPETRGKDLIG